MSTDKEPSLLANVWVQCNLALNLKNLMAITSFDVEYVRNINFPFIQLVKTGSEFQKETTVNFIQTSVGWVIHDYDEAISASTALDMSAKVGLWLKLPISC